MNDPEYRETCNRCNEEVPSGKPVFMVEIDAEPPLTNPISLRICESCMESMTRWVQRRGRGGSRGGGKKDAEPAGSGHRRRKPRRSVYERVLDQDAELFDRKTLLTIMALVVPAIVVTLCIVTFLKYRPH
jgi:hypothetical protein